MSGKVPASIETIVNDLPDISWEQVIFEAITNSLQAHATEINIKFIHYTLDLSETKKYIEQIVIEDNGEGFNEKNVESFENYRSQFKKELGCKGIGRFLYLKIFKKIYIESLNKKIYFVIDKDIVVTPAQENFSTTKIFFNEPKQKFIVDYKSFEQKIRDHFIAYFKLLNDQKISIDINIYENNIKQLIIKNTEIPKFETKKFKIQTHNFILDYVIHDDSIKKYDGFYCAGGRVVTKNSLLDTKRKLHAFKDINILYLISSQYLDNSVNKTRDDFTIMPIRKNEDLLHNLSWKEIHSELANQIKEIAREHQIDIEKISQENLAKARQTAPFLSYYLQDNEYGLSDEDLISKAQKRLENDKEALRENDIKIKNDYDQILGIVTQAELAEYIFDRQKKIDLLKKLTSDDALEKEIHNLFMERYTKDENKNYKSNNLWLFDDRFMTYDKVFSEAQLKEIFPDLVNNIDRPDILSIVSNTFDSDRITDIVLIELKRPSDKITPAEAQRELRSYADYINKSRQENKIRIWAYAFLKFNEFTERDLRLDEYNQIPTQSQYPIYYKFNNRTNIIINFLDYSSIAYDADTRNKTFIKILNGESFKNKLT